MFDNHNEVFEHVKSLAGDVNVLKKKWKSIWPLTSQ